jgi:hypothetical protein
MATPPPPPPRDPRFLPRPAEPGPWRAILKVALYLVGGFVLLVVVGVGLIFATCVGMGR